MEDFFKMNEEEYLDPVNLEVYPLAAFDSELRRRLWLAVLQVPRPAKAAVLDGNVFGSDEPARAERAQEDWEEKREEGEQWIPCKSRRGLMKLAAHL